MRRFLAFTAAAILAIPAPSAGAGAFPRIEGAKSPVEAGDTRALLETLDAWLTAYSDYPQTDRPLTRIRLVEPGFELQHEGRGTVLGGALRGAYIDDTATIYLLRPWYPDRPEDQSVLLHELVHHRQVDARHWYCGQAMEWDAYKLQEKFLSTLDRESGFHWAGILLESSCAVRDHHPE